MFGPNVVESAKSHALKVFPQESCGMVVDNAYVKCTNISPTPENDFIINPQEHLSIKQSNNEIQAIIHSHTNGKDFPSKSDMIQQMKMNVPWGIVTVKNYIAENPFWFGDSVPIADFVGRKFKHGVSDCFALARDWFRKEHGIYIPDFPRNDQWWLNGEDMFHDFMIDAGFYEIHKAEKVGDIFIGKIMGKVPNHCAVYLGNGLILHHLSNRLSNRELVDRWMKFVCMVLRHKDMPC